MNCRLAPPFGTNDRRECNGSDTQWRQKRLYVSSKDGFQMGSEWRDCIITYIELIQKQLEDSMKTRLHGRVSFIHSSLP